MATNLTFTLLVPTLNEIDGMRLIMPKVHRDWVDQILIVDGKSTDGTIEYAKENGYEIYVQKRDGPRFLYNEALEHVRGDVVVVFSPDGNSLPELIPPLVAKMREGYDMVIASRYLGNARSQDDSLLTGFGNWLFNRLINLLYGATYTDSMVLFRAWPKRLFYELDLHKDESHAPEKWFGTVISVEPLLSIRAAKCGLKITEIPGDEPARVGGVAKLQPFRWGASYLSQIIREIWTWRPRKGRTRPQGFTT
jgi:glycosyltransferase involved in cell wall biosynthesis